MRILRQSIIPLALDPKSIFSDLNHLNSMETEIQDKPEVNKKGYIIAAVLILVFMVYYLVMMLLAPAILLKSLKENYELIQAEGNPADERILTDSAYLSLQNDKAYLQSRIAMAETDSIYLTINMADSIAELETSGVSVHKAAIKKADISRILKYGDNNPGLTMLSRPLTIVRDFSSIQKEPLMIKMAPKDTSEYVPDIIPDTADYEPVNYILEMDNGIIFSIYQEEKIRLGDGMDLFGFDLRYRIRNTIKSLGSVFTLKIPEYHPFIKIRLPRKDAKIIYRALPLHGQVAIKL